MYIHQQRLKFNVKVLLRCVGFPVTRVSLKRLSDDIWGHGKTPAGLLGLTEGKIKQLVTTPRYIGVLLEVGTRMCRVTKHVDQRSGSID